MVEDFKCTLMNVRVSDITLRVILGLNAHGIKQLKVINAFAKTPRTCDHLCGDGVGMVIVVAGDNAGFLIFLQQTIRL